MAEQIYAPGPMATPAQYVVPGSSEIVPIAVQAELDGMHASGDFVPALIFRSQAGHVIARVPTSTTVVAGGSAEVSWFPGVKPSSAGGAAPSVLAYTQGVLDGAFDPPFTVTPDNALSLPFPSVSVSDPTVFEWSSVTHPNDHLAFLKTGLYIGSVGTIWEPHNFPHYAIFNGPARIFGVRAGTPSNEFTASLPDIGGIYETDTVSLQHAVSAPVTGSVFVYNGDVGNRQVVTANVGFFYLGDVV